MTPDLKEKMDVLVHQDLLGSLVRLGTGDLQARNRKRARGETRDRKAKQDPRGRQEKEDKADPRVKSDNPE